NTQATAYNLGTVSTTLNKLAMVDTADWFKFSTSFTGIGSVSIAFQQSQGDLDLELYNSAGKLVGQSRGEGNSETISLTGLPVGTYSARVYGYQGAINPSYSLTTALPAPP